MSIPVDRDLINAGISDFGKFVGNTWRKERQVKLGHPADKSLIYSNNEKTTVYIHGMGNNPSSFEQMAVSGIPSEKLIWGAGISIKQTETGAWRYSAPDLEYDQQFSAGLEGNQTQTKVNLSQVDYGTAHPYSGLVLFIRGAMYGNEWVVDQFTADFSTGTVQDTSAANITIPTTNNRKKLVLIQVTPSTGALSYKQSSEFAATVSNSEAYINDLLPTPDDSAYRICYAELVKGITTFKRKHIWTVPELFVKGGAGEWEITLSANKILAANKQAVIDKVIVPTGITLTITSTAILKVI